MYSVLSYGQMAADGARIDAYARAIAKTVRPGDVVVDLGCGPGIMSLLALRAGAKRVHAIELDPVVWLARDLAVENGFGDRFEVHHASSFDVSLSELADVAVADMRGSCPLFQQNLAAMEDAKKRLLRAGGTLIPANDRLFVALVDVETVRRDIELGFTSLERRGFTASAARAATLNCTYTDADNPLLASQQISDAKPWGEVRYGEPFARSYSATVDLTMTRGGTAHALAVWFDATLADGIGFSNSPGHRMVYKRTVLPLLDAVTVAAGDTARVTLRTDARGDQWAWDTEIGGHPRTRQATFLGLQTSQEALLREALGATPERSLVGDRAARVLAMMDGTHTVNELAEAISSADPTLRKESVLDEVKGCVRRYGR